MNPRYQYGGDKHESIKSDAQRTWAQMVNDQQQDILATLKSVVSTWTENEWINGNIDEMRFNRFLLHYPEWDYEELYATISEEMERVLAICDGVQAS